MVKAEVFLFSKPFDGPPEEENFKLVEENLPPLKNGGKLGLLRKQLNYFILESQHFFSAYSNSY